MNLECFIIATDNDFIHQYHAIRQRGYDVTIFPASFDKSLLTDARSKECSGYFVDVHAHTDEFVRNLRQSWCAMLRSAGDKEGIIFCEADALPLMRAGIVAEKLRRDEENHPDCDVWKLYPEILLNAPVGLAPSNEAGFSFHDWPKYERDACVKSVWGTHALYIPAKSRGKVAKVFSELPMPVDVALEYANYKGDLKVRECSYPLFAQCQHAQQAVVEPRVAAVMSTYNRISDAQRQIWCMMDQSYKNFHLYVSVKGVSEADFRLVLLPQFKHFIDAGRLTIRMGANRNQISNFLDCIRDVPSNAYDLYAKIDDDDFYPRDYIKSIVAFHRILPSGIGSYDHGQGPAIIKTGRFSHQVNSTRHWQGNSFVLPGAVIDTLREVEKNPQLADEYGKQHGVTFSGYGFAEDVLMQVLNMRRGAQNRYLFIKEAGRNGMVLSNLSNNSTSRGDRGVYLSPEAEKNICKFGEKDSTPATSMDEYFLLVYKDRALHPATIVGDMIKMGKLTGDVIKFDAGRAGDFEMDDGSQLRLRMSKEGIYVSV